MVKQSVYNNIRQTQTLLECYILPKIQGVKVFNFHLHQQVSCGHRGRAWRDATITKALRGFKDSMWSILRNKRISRKRSLVECQFAIMKRVFHLSHTLVTLSGRVRVKFMFSYFAYNLFALRINLNRGNLSKFPRKIGEIRRGKEYFKDIRSNNPE